MNAFIKISPFYSIINLWSYNMKLIHKVARFKRAIAISFQGNYIGF